jgi:hypothetical protein
LQKKKIIQKGEALPTVPFTLPIYTAPVQFALVGGNRGTLK